MLLAVIDQELTWRDIRIETGRRGSNFYYSIAAAVTKLDQAGAVADDLIVKYQDRKMNLSEAYRQFAESLLQALLCRDVVFSQSNLFVLEFPAGTQ